MAGCSSDPLPADTAELPRDRTVGPRVYLNDSATAAAAIRDFSGVLDNLGGTVTPVEARGVAPDLMRHAETLCAVSGRLSNQRLEDAQVEAQRDAVAGPVADICLQMTAIAEAADAGNVRAMASIVRTYTAAVARVRDVAA